MNDIRVSDKFSSALWAELVSGVETSAPSRQRKPVRLWLAAGALAGAGLLGGVAAGVFVLPGSPQTSPQSSGLSSYRVEDTLGAFSGLSHDYDPLPSPKALAATSQVVVQGTVKGIREGTTGTGINSIVVVVNVERVVQGELPQGNDGNVHLEFSGSGSSDPTYYTKALPEGATVVAYVVAAPDTSGEGIDVTIKDPTAGRPEGQSVFLPTGPQGLILQVGEEDIIWPLIGARAPGNIADTLPDGNLIRG